MIPQFVVSHDEDVRARGRNISYKLPRPITTQSLAMISHRFIERVLVDAPTAVHFVAIANSGVVIAADAMATYRQRANTSWTAISVLNLSQPVNIIDLSSAPGKVKTIVVDNSMKSGKTMCDALTFLDKADIRVDEVVKLIDYSDPLEDEVKSFISSWFKVNIISLYSKAEIDAYVSSSPAGA